VAVRSWRSGFGTQALRLVSSTCVLISTYSKNNISDSSGIFRGWRWCNRPLWSDREFLDNFCSVFVSINLRLNCKIRVPRLLPVKNCIKIIILRTKKIIFFLERCPAPPPYSPSSTPTAPRPSLLKSYICRCQTACILLNL